MYMCYYCIRYFLHSASQYNPATRKSHSAPPPHPAPSGTTFSDSANCSDSLNPLPQNI